MDRRVYALLVVVLLAAPAGFVPRASAFDEDVVPFSNRFPVEIDIPGHASVYELAEMGLDIDAAGDRWVRAYLNEAEVEQVELLGYTVRRIPNQPLRMSRSLEEQPSPAKDEWDHYHTYTQLTTFLQTVAAEHSDIVRLQSIGTSVQGRSLWIVKITDNPGVQEAEPEFKYIATLHGDEPVGTENCLRLIQLLTDNYASANPDPDLEKLVNRVELWIVPMINPDGNTSVSRYNAHGVDLNRDFPDWVTDPNNTPAGREPETGAMMVFCDTMSFDLSANFHGGALVVNYPHDNRYELAPDDALFIVMSKAYSVHNVPMWNNPEFQPYGITNGAAWYIVYGGMQNWNYDFMYDKEVTIELGNTKRPAVSYLPGLWSDNQESMIAYMEYCMKGIRGRVTDAATGDPLDATVTVAGNTYVDRTDPDVGDYHRILLPGTYSLTFSAANHIDQTISNVVVIADSATVVNAQLGSTAQITVSGTVTDEGGGPLSATVEARYLASGALAASTNTDPVDGSYSLNVSPAEYEFAAWAAGHSPAYAEAFVTADTTIDFVLGTASGSILVIDNDEGKRLERKDPYGAQSEFLAEGERASAADLAADLAVLGYQVTQETAAGTNPATWPSYDVVVWSCGKNTAPLSYSGDRRDLINYCKAGGKLLIEGGEIAYDATGYPTYPNFADSVLHIDAWNGDQAGNLWRPASQAGHAIATEPNPLPQTIPITFDGWGSQDAARPVSPAYLVYGTTSQPTFAGILVFDGGESGTEGNVVFFSFSYTAVSDAGQARNLLQNVVTYLMTPMTGVEDSRPGTRVATGIRGASPNPFNPATTIGFSLATRDHVRLTVYDVRGRMVASLLEGVVEPGVHEVAWDGRDSRGEEIASGVYFCRMTVGGATHAKKIVKLN